MAEGYARVSGKPGVVLVTSGLVKLSFVGFEITLITITDMGGLEQ